MDKTLDNIDLIEDIQNAIKKLKSDQKAHQESDDKPEVSAASTSDNRVTTVNHSVMIDIDECQIKTDEDKVNEYYRNLLKILAQAGDKASLHEVHGYKPLLHPALTAGRSNKSTTKLLISLGVSVNVPDDLGLTPLHWVTLCTENDSHLGTAKLLLDKGANLLAKDKKGKTPIEYLFGPENDRDNPRVKLLFACRLIKPVGEPLKLWIEERQVLSPHDLAIRTKVEKEEKVKQKIKLDKIINKVIIINISIVVLVGVMLFVLFY